MIDGTRRGYEIGRDLSKLFGVPGIPREQVFIYARDTLNFLRAANFAHLEPDFIENFVKGWDEPTRVKGYAHDES